MLEITVKGQPVEAKFDFRALFRANNLFSSGENANDGASSIWVQLIMKDDMALFHAIRVLLPKSYSDEDIMDFLDETDADGSVDKLASDVEEEMRKSSFFRRAAKRWLEFSEKYDNAGKKPTTAAEKTQAATVKDIRDAVKKSLS
jgi:hypothetical protein